MGFIKMATYSKYFIICHQFEPGPDGTIDVTNLSEEAIAGAAGAVRGLLDSISSGPDTGPVGAGSSFGSSIFDGEDGTEDDDEESVLVIGLGANLITVMSEAGLQLPAGEGSANTRWVSKTGESNRLIGQTRKMFKWGVFRIIGHQANGMCIGLQKSIGCSGYTLFI